MNNPISIGKLLKDLIDIIKDLVKTELSENGRINLTFTILLIIVILIFFLRENAEYKFLSVILLFILIIFSMITVKNTNETLDKHNAIKKLRQVQRDSDKHNTLE